MRKFLVSLIVLLVPALCVAEPIGAPAFRVGSSIYLSFTYEGGVEGWDGRISHGEHGGLPSITTSNSVFMVLTKGRQQFVSEMHKSGDVVPLWKTFTAKHGVLVPPIGRGVDPVAYNVALVSPFRTVLDLSKYFHIDSTGIYTVYWGMRNLWEEEIVFEVLPADAGEGVEELD